MISIEPYLVTSNWERLMVSNIVRNGTLWSDIVFKKEVICTWIWFQDLGFRIWSLEINHLNAHNFVWQGLFFFHYYLAPSMTDWAQILSSRFVILCIMLRSSEKSGLWQFPVVSCDFKDSKPSSLISNLNPSHNVKKYWLLWVNLITGMVLFGLISQVGLY